MVVNVPDVWGMLLFRKFTSKLGGTLEMDLTYVEYTLEKWNNRSLPNVTMTRNPCARS
jgi:hypothetical protein